MGRAHYLFDAHAARLVEQIAQVDTPQALYDQPSCDFASVFLGKTNRFEGTVAHEQAVRVGELTLTAHCPVASGAVVAYLRPEKIVIGAPGQPGLDGTIKTLLFLGSQWAVNVETALGEVHVSVPNTGSHRWREGAPVTLSWDPEHLRVLSHQDAGRG